MRLERNGSVENCFIYQIILQGLLAALDISYIFLNYFCSFSSAFEFPISTEKSANPHSVRVDYLREIVEIIIYVFAIAVSTIFLRLFLPPTVAFRLQERRSCV